MRIACALLLFCVSCAAGPGGAADATDPNQQTVDAGDPDAGTPAEADGGGLDAGDGNGTALTLTLLDGGTRPFDVAGAGITVGSPNTLYVEAWQGGFTGCPEQGSPTPARTLILNGVVLDGRTSQDTDVTGTLFDYDGDILASEPFVRATAVRVSAIENHLCAPGTDCDDSDDVRFEVEATFAIGTVAGTVFAPHCRSMDE